MCVFVCSYSIQLAAALAELRPLSGGQLRLQAALLVQQVAHQNIDQVGAAGGRQNLHLRSTEHRIQKTEELMPETRAWPALPVPSHLVQEAGEEGVGRRVVEERPLVHQDDLNVLAEHWILT